MADAAFPLHPRRFVLLLPGRRGHLIWALAVLALHAALVLGWQRRGEAEAPLRRMSIQLTEPARAARTAPPQALTKRLPAPAAAPQLQAPLDLAEAPPALPPLPALAALEPLPTLPYEPGPEWPLSTRLVYRVEGHFRGPVHGDAEVEWLRQGEQYQVHLRLSVGPRLLPFAARDLVSEGRVTPEGVSPRRYEERTRIGLAEPRRATLLVHEGLLRFANGRQQPAPPGLQDSASQFAQLAWLLHSGRVPLQAGQVIELPLALPQGLRGWRYEIVGSEVAETPLHPATELWHLRPQPPLPPGALAAEVWLAPQLNFLPLRLRIRQGPETWLMLHLDAMPLQENAPSASEPISP